ncbi:sigma-54 interaction domain-containing protein [Hornefia butyriciproducens]|uniref:sigma-54 interaction domain-containing protein n=1 Tax=Hornefia butyriciproducens TaxID=2652293 RepID=UPI002A914CD8|nr:sigma 54-interacting transcriptional regulator [Hornefia butyriciproducens]MDY5423182.1 sigma 54-interacting transcriptional regulator [Hornefia butyriciproducens]
MEREFGLGRVLEPKGVFPPIAWRLDTDREIRRGEARIRLELINIEWDSFQQICSSSGYAEDKIRARIFDIVEKRGKLQNPFTRSGGVLMGTVEAVSPSFNADVAIQPGDRIYCLTSLTSLPLHIDEITEIDFDYGQIRCSGYGIIFETSPVYRPSMLLNLSDKAMMAAFDESGSIYGSYIAAQEQDCHTVAILGNNLHTMLLYAASMREAIGPEYQVIGIVDDYYNDNISREEIVRVLTPLIKDIHFVNFSEPVKTYETLKQDLKIRSPIDMVIVTDDIAGTETMAVELVKNRGAIYFTSFDSNYNIAALCAEALGKMVISYAFDQFIDGFLDFSRQILYVLAPKLEEIDGMYRSYSGSRHQVQSRAKSRAVENAGRDDGFIYQDIVTRNMVEDVLNIAHYDCNVIIQGETGVGKEKVLELIHQNSERCAKPCVRINCATIQENLAESEFFGYESGAFTGAQAGGKAGYFEAANEGILFLDEIGTLSMNMQSKLLRVLQENQFYRVGGTKQINVNVRVICANNVPLRQLVDQGKFREDLYYRLNICTIEVPPLRERRADILVMAEFFVEKCNKRYGTAKELSPEALNRLYDYYWPGNVRELENVVHRLVISTRGNVIGDEDVDALLNESAYGDLVRSIRKTYDRNDRLDFHQIMEQQEKRLIEYALKKEKTTRKAADMLGLPQTTLARKKLKYGL